MPIDESKRPIIVIGMHRSGTSLLTRLLEAGGAFWGCDKDEYNESVLFQELNEALLSIGGGTWDHPVAFIPGLSDPQAAARMETVAGGARTEAFRTAYFFGRHRPAGDQVCPSGGRWGWKDPRNAFTLPVWRRVFPEARVIHILRNGIDVAASLWKRETSRPEGKNHPHYSARCQNIEGCFELWKDYVRIGLRHAGTDAGAIAVRFENLVREPRPVLERLCGFLDLPPAGPIRRACEVVDRERAFAYRQSVPRERLRERMTRDPVMVRLGYC